MAIHVSSSFSLKSNRPTAPAYTPLRSCSNPPTSSMALILGAPETVPAGTMDRNASNLLIRGVSVALASDRSLYPPGLSVPQLPTDLTCQMDNVTELFHFHQLVNLDRLRLAHPVDVVPGQIYQHDVFCAVFFACKEALAKFNILCGMVRLSALYRLIGNAVNVPFAVFPRLTVPAIA